MVDIQLDKLTITCLVNSFKKSNTYIIGSDGSDAVWLIDVGDADKILEKIGVKSVAGIFITHAHLDHIYGLQQICNQFPDCIVYGSELGLHYLFDDKRNLSFYYGTPLNLSLGHCCPLKDGECIQILGNSNIECFYTPGHTLDSACYQLNNNIFTGDAYIPGIRPVTKLWGGNKVEADKSLQIIKEHIIDETMIFPGHTIK